MKQHPAKKIKEEEPGPGAPPELQLQLVSGTGAGPGEHRGASLLPAEEGLADTVQDGQSATHTWSGASLALSPTPSLASRRQCGQSAPCGLARRPHLDQIQGGSPSTFTSPRLLPDSFQVALTGCQHPAPTNSMLIKHRGFFFSQLNRNLFFHTSSSHIS